VVEHNFRFVCNFLARCVVVGVARVDGAYTMVIKLVIVVVISVLYNHIRNNLISGNLKLELVVFDLSN
jgi:hypothetical protein